MKAIARPLQSSAGDWLLEHLADPAWTTFRACVAYLKQSGSKHVAADLHAYSRRPGTTCRVAVGISSQGTSLEGVQDVWRVLTGHGDFNIVHEGTGGRGSFHPKGYAFSNGTGAALLIGSANLTEGGLFTNHELSVALDLDFRDAAHAALFAEIEMAFDDWQTPGSHSLSVTPQLIRQLHARGDLPSEATIRVVSRTAAAARRATPSSGVAGTTPPSAFGASPIMRPPKPKALPPGLPAAPVVPTTPAAMVVTAPPAGPKAVGSGTATAGVATANTPAPPSPPAPGAQQFVIEVRPHHNGELFLSYRAIHDNAGFFGYPFAGWTTPKRAGNNPYPQLTPDPVVDILIYDRDGRVRHRKQPHPLNVVDYEPKREIRVTIPDGLQRDIPQMSVLVMTLNPSPALDYRLEFFPPGTAPAVVTARMQIELPSGGAEAPRHYGWS